MWWWERRHLAGHASRVRFRVTWGVVVEEWINGRRRGAGDRLPSTVFMMGPGYVIPIPGSRS